MEMEMESWNSLPNSWPANPVGTCYIPPDSGSLDAWLQAPNPGRLFGIPFLPPESNLAHTYMPSFVGQNHVWQNFEGNFVGQEAFSNMYANFQWLMPGGKQAVNQKQRQLQNTEQYIHWQLRSELLKRKFSQVDMPSGSMMQYSNLPNPLKQDMLRVSAQPLLEMQYLIDRRKQLSYPQMTILDTSAMSGDSMAHVGDANGGDWQEEAYQKIKQMKDQYLLALGETHQKICTILLMKDSLPQVTNSALKLCKSKVELCIKVLLLSKSIILPACKEKLAYLEKIMMKLTEKNWLDKLVPVPPQMHQTLLPPSQTHSLNPTCSQTGMADVVPNICGVVTSTTPLDTATRLGEFSDHGDTRVNSLLVVSGEPGIVEQPLDRLIKAVKSMSSKSLSASVSDIGLVVSMMDRMAGSAYGNGSRAAVGEDLHDTVRRNPQLRKFVIRDGLNSASSSSHSVIDSSEQAGVSEIFGSKRPKLKAINHDLLEEIREINQHLVDTVLDMREEEDLDPSAVTCKGIVVICSFIAVSLSSNLKSQFALGQTSPTLSLRLLVPTSYPNSSPVLLDKFPMEVIKESDEDLSVRVKSRFSVLLRSLSQPMSLGEIARTWDTCAREVISNHVQWKIK